MTTFDQEQTRRALSHASFALHEAQQTSLRIPHTKDLPSVFNEIAPCLPLVQGVCDICKNYVAAFQNDVSIQDIRPTIDGCKDKAVKLDEIFQQVIGSTDARKKYREVASGCPLEDVMKVILEHEIELATTLPFKDVLGPKVDELKETLVKVQAIPVSLVDEKSSYSFRNEGDGWMNVNTGTGPQHNNNGSGNQFNGPIHGLQLPK
ncbi:hypothetical protein N7493_001323 [Penicillium malachiteum]|uniref:NACHT-NTPase and P-loop NTPases N-terminal domain-containing protein n=1 Tax=Penicillium malachiteum TaxID=1324776 RepID=A0AAD6MZU0_9EURO|nr:hypothetical protein N7493_001323 [Penicillium malachiteum]